MDTSTLFLQDQSCDGHPEHDGNHDILVSGGIAFILLLACTVNAVIIVRLHVQQPAVMAGAFQRTALLTCCTLQLRQAVVVLLSLLLGGPVHGAEWKRQPPLSLFAGYEAGWVLEKLKVYLGLSIVVVLVGSVVGLEGRRARFVPLTALMRFLRLVMPGVRGVRPRELRNSPEDLNCPWYLLVAAGVSFVCDSVLFFVTYVYLVIPSRDNGKLYYLAAVLLVVKCVFLFCLRPVVG